MARPTRERIMDTSGDTSQIGVIYGVVGTHEFKFAADEGKVKLSDYVQVRHDKHGWVLGQITNLERESNVTYNYAQMISVGADVKVDSKLASVVSVLGFKDERGLIQMPHTPFSAGANVYLATGELIQEVLGLEHPGPTGAYMGILKGHKIPVNLDINTLVQKHVSIIAKTGSGKSYIAGVLVEELIKRNIPVIIIDPHGEYSSMLHPNLDERDIRVMNKFKVIPRGYPKSVVEYSLDNELNLGSIPLKLDGVKLQASELIPILGLKTTGVQVGILYQALNNVKHNHQYYTIRNIIDEVQEDKNTLKWNLVNLLEHLDSLDIFSTVPTSLKDLVAPGKATLINLRGVPPNVQDIAVAQLSAKLFEARKRNRIPACMYMLEEAHNFCPQQGTAVSANILKTIASEGRKFGLGLTVVSQRPAKVDKNVLSQCNTQMILKVTNPNDLKALIASVEGLDYRMTDEIQRLPVGVALLAGGAINLPILVEVRPRETKHGGRPVEIIGDGVGKDALDTAPQPLPPEMLGGEDQHGEQAESDWYSTLIGSYEKMIKNGRTKPEDDIPEPKHDDIDDDKLNLLEDKTLEDIGTRSKRSKKR
jgi:DNA helicase HerA-like ATPase